MKAVIVTGGSGFVGRNLVGALQEKGYFIYNIVRHSDTLCPNSKNYQEIICANRQELPNIPKQINHSISYLFHLGWSGASGKERAMCDIQMENILFSYELLDMVQKLSIEKFLFAGSIMEYECLINVLQDNATYNTNMYAAAKVSAHLILQLFARSKGIAFIPLLLSNIYGSDNQSQSFINRLVKKMCTESSIALTEGSRLYDFIYISDAVEMMIQIAEGGEAYKQYYIGNEQQIPLKEFVQRAADSIGYTGLLDFGAVPYQDIPLNYKEFDVHSFYEDFSYHPKVTFEDGIRKLYEEMEGKQ